MASRIFNVINFWSIVLFQFRFFHYIKYGSEGSSAMLSTAAFGSAHIWLNHKQE